MDESPAADLADPLFVSRRAIRLALAFGVAAALTGAMVLASGGGSLLAFVYNVPVFLVFGLWLTRACCWLRDRRWGQLAMGAAAIAAAMMRLGIIPTAGQFPASGHATFLAYTVVGTRRDALLIWSAAVVLVEVAALKVAWNDITSLWAGLVLGILLGAAARVLDRPRDRVGKLHNRAGAEVTAETARRGRPPAHPG